MAQCLYLLYFWLGLINIIDSCMGIFCGLSLFKKWIKVEKWGKIKQAQKCSIFGPQNLGGGGPESGSPCIRIWVPVDYCLLHTDNNNQNLYCLLDE